MTVGRESLIRELVADLVRQARDRVRQPWLLYAPRGFGKTHLLAVLYHRLRRDADLRRQLLPLWLPESDALVAFDVRSFLDQILGQLADERRDDPDAAVRVRAAMGADFSPAGISMREECLVREAAAAGVTFIVFVENLDALAAVLDRSPASREAKRLRVLLTQPRFPIFVCTTTRARFESIESPLRPLHQLFRSRHVPPLDEEESTELYRRLRTANRLPGQTADLEPWDRARIGLFHRLTGGSPRSIVIAFAAITAADGIGALVAELESLLDRHTPTFEQRFADLAPRERAIVATMATAPTTLTLQEIAAQSGLPLRSLSTQVDRLSEIGWVAEAFDAGGKGTLWEIRDGLFRVWLQYRRGNRVLAPLVRFLALWFEPDEIAQSIEMSAARSSASEPLEARESTVRYLREAYALARTPEIVAERAAIRREFSEVVMDQSACERAPSSDSHGRSEPDPHVRSAVNRELAAVLELNRSGRHEVALAKLDETIKRLLAHAGSREEAALAEAMVARGRTLGGLGRPQDEIASYDEVVSRFGERPELALAEQVAMALFNRGVTQDALGRAEDAIATYDEVVRRFGDRPEPALLEQVAKALVNKGGRQGEISRAEDAIATYDEVARRFGERPEPELTEQVAMALFNKGITQGELGRTENEITTYDEVVRRFGERLEPELLEKVAKALVNKGGRRAELGQTEDAITTYDEVVRRFGQRPQPALAEPVARALVSKGVEQGALGQAEDEIATYDDVVQRFGERPEPALAEWVARALFNKGVVQGELGRAEDAIATYDEVAQRFGERPELALQEQIAKALVNKGFTQGVLGRAENEISTYDDVMHRFGERQEVTLLEQVAKAIFNKGITQGALGRAEDTIATYDEVVRRFGERPEPALTEPVAKALFNKGITQGALGRAEDAIATYDEVVRRFGERAEPTLAEQGAMALFNKGITQGALGRVEDAIATYDEVERLFGERPEPALLEQVAKALVNKGVAQGALGRVETELATYNKVVQWFGERPEPGLGEPVARALVNTGGRQGVLRQFEGALSAFDDVIVRFAEAPGAELRRIVADALVGKLIVCTETADDVGVAASIRRYAAHVVTLPTNTRPALDAPLVGTATRFGPQRLRAWLEPMRRSGDPDLAATVRIFDYVLDVVDAAESTTSGVARSPGLKQRMARALARVPIEYRATVRERADSVIRARRQFKPGRRRPAES